MYLHIWAGHKKTEQNKEKHFAYILEKTSFVSLEMELGWKKVKVL